jgi:hypothetical protein
MDSMKDRFTYVYDNDIWGGSGGGSSVQYLGPYIDWLNKFIKDNNIKSVGDYGCGISGFGTSLQKVMYYGVDIVEWVIDYCDLNFSSLQRDYFVIDEPNLTPVCELLIVKDVFMHWQTSEIVTFLDSVIEKHKHIVVVNSIGQTKDNEDYETPHHLYARGLSYKFQPLSKYNPELIMELNVNKNDPKEVLLITNHNL